MIYLKQSTAKTLRFGPFLDDTDGKTAETGLTVSQADIRLSKNGGAFAQTNDASGASHDENGWYSLQLDATDTNTLGPLTVAIAESGALPVWREFMVVPANVYDSLVSGSDSLDVNVKEISEDSTAADNLEADYDGTGYNKSASTIGTATNVTNGVDLADDAITASKYDESTAFPVASADSGSTAIARTGADADTLETLSDEIAAVQSTGGNIVLQSGTAQSGASNNIQIAVSASSTDDYYRGKRIVLTGGTGAGQSRTINNYTGASRDAGVTPNWHVTPDNTTTYEVHAAEVDVGAILNKSVAYNQATLKLKQLHADNGTDGEGIYARGTNGIYGEATGGTDNAGVKGYGSGGNSHGIFGKAGAANTDGHGIYGLGAGGSDATGNGIFGQAVEEGDGIRGAGGTGSGSGIKTIGGIQNGSGISCNGQGNGKGIDAKEIGTPTDLGSGSSLAANLSDMAGATFATGTDSQEAIANAIAALNDLDSAAVQSACDAAITANTDINNIDTGVNNIEAKLPTNYIMGSSDQTDKDDDIDAILEDTGTTLPATLTTIDGKLDTIDGIVDDILADTNELQGDWTDGGRLDLVLDAIAVDVAGLDGDAMRGTDSAALASVCTEARLAELDAANLPSDIDDILEDTGTTLPTTLSSMDGKLDTIDGIVDDILDDTAEIGASGAGLSAIPWNAAWDAEVESECNDAIELNHLDHLFKTAYDATSKPGAADALLNEMVEDDSGLTRYTANALEQAPGGGGVAADVNVVQWNGSAVATPSVAGVPEVDITHIGGNSVVGNLATLTLKQLDIQNTDGHALIAKTTGDGYDGIRAESAAALGGTGNGISAMCSGTNHDGHGLYAAAAQTPGSDGDGIRANGGDNSGNGILAEASYGEGMYIKGAGSYAGMKIEASQYGTGHGLHIVAGTNSGGSLGDSSGVYIQAGEEGHGIWSKAGSGGGAGIKTLGGTNNGAGFDPDGQGTGKDIDATEIGAPTDLGSGSSLAANLSDMAGATFATGTDSQEAIANAIAALNDLDSAAVQSACDAAITANTDINNIDTGVNNIEAKLPTNYIMGSSDQTDKDDDIDAILEDTGTTLPATLTTIDGKLDTIDGIVDDILADTNELQGDWTDGGRLDLILDAIAVDVAGLDGDAMRGTDSAALASVCTEARLAELDAANLPSDIDNILADTNELQTDWANGGRLDLILDAVLADTNDIVTYTGTSIPAQIAALNNLSASDLQTALGTNGSNEVAELGVGAPTSTPTMAQVMSLLYMGTRNKRTSTATEKSIYNNGGTKIAKKTTSDDGTTYTEEEMVSA